MLRNLVLFFEWEDAQESGLIEIIPFICISDIWGQYTAFFHILSSLGATIGNGCSLMAVRSQVFFFLSALRAHQLTLEGCNC